MILHTFYGGLNKENKRELDSASNGAFIEINMHDAWNLLETIHHNKETYNEWEQNKTNGPVDYDCIRKFLNTGKEEYLTESFKLDHETIVRIIKAYAEYLQVPRHWYHFEPPDARSFMITVVESKLTQEKEMQQSIQEPNLALKKEGPLNKRKEKKMERNVSVIKSNIGIVKELMEPEEVDDEVVVLDPEAARLIDGRSTGKDGGKPRIPISFAGVTYIGLCDLSATINIMPYSIYELIRYELDEPELEPTNTTVMLSNRTIQGFDGILRNINVSVGSFMYPIDFHVVDLPRDPFRPIILGRPFFEITTTNIDDASLSSTNSCNSQMTDNVKIKFSLFLLEFSK